MKGLSTATVSNVMQKLIKKHLVSLKVISRGGEGPAILILDLAPLLAEYQKAAEKD